MSKIEFELMVTEQRVEGHGRQPISRATMPSEYAFIGGGEVSIEGDLTFRGLKVPLGQRLKVEITLVEAPAPVRRDFRTNQPILD